MSTCAENPHQLPDFFTYHVYEWVDYFLRTEFHMHIIFLFFTFGRAWLFSQSFRRTLYSLIAMSRLATLRIVRVLFILWTYFKTNSFCKEGCRPYSNMKKILDKNFDDLIVFLMVRCICGVTLVTASGKINSGWLSRPSGTCRTRNMNWMYYFWL